MAYKQPSSGPFKMMGSSPAKQKKGKHPRDFTDPKYDYKSTDFLKTDYASGHGVGDLTTIKRMNKSQQKHKSKDYKDNTKSTDTTNSSEGKMMAKMTKFKKVKKKKSSTQDNLNKNIQRGITYSN